MYKGPVATSFPTTWASVLVDTFTWPSVLLQVCIRLFTLFLGNVIVICCVFIIIPRNSICLVGEMIDFLWFTVKPNDFRR